VKRGAKLTARRRSFAEEVLAAFNLGGRDAALVYVATMAKLQITCPVCDGLSMRWHPKRCPLCDGALKIAPGWARRAMNPGFGHR